MALEVVKFLAGNDETANYKPTPPNPYWGNDHLPLKDIWWTIEANESLKELGSLLRSEAYHAVAEQ